MKVFISQPMKGLSKEEILRNRQEAKLKLVFELNNCNIEFIDPCMRYSDPIMAVGESVKRMAEANVVYFMHGWEKHRGCRIEHQVAVEYGIRCILYEG
jgi:hypothetical protein